MAAAPFDTLKLARALRDRAGFSQEHAEAAADALAESLAEQVSTKQDVKDLGTGLRIETKDLGNELRAEIKDLGNELRAEMADFRTEMRAEIAALRAEITAAEQRTIIRLGGMLVVMTGILLAAKFFG
ncbi:MAG TPA: hypothetical protein VEK82_14930 [Stellaceae bacterium]|nr:hypothetical protein [Stellaceae bacterium]